MTLNDLNLLGKQAKDKYISEYVWREFELSDEFKECFKQKNSTNVNSRVQFDKYTVRTTSSTGKTTDFPNQSFEVASYFVDYLREGCKYRDIARRCFSRLQKQHGVSFEEKDFFAELRDAGQEWKTILSQKMGGGLASDFDDLIQDELQDINDRRLLLKCLTEKGWSYGNKTIDRGDYFNSGILNLAGVVNVSQAFLAELVWFLSENPDLEQHLKNNIKAIKTFDKHESFAQNLQKTAISGGKNLIVYGAPGAGKSYYIDNETKTFHTIRTVFHPEYQNSDFTGSLRPSVNEQGEVTYSFVPGPFIKAILAANKNPQEHVYLLIEEINRANAASVFGDIFQLLDRNDSGQSQYTIHTEEALEKYLTASGYHSPNTLRIPSNLSIYATMNSSDQGVFMMDTAFKRRWQFHYCPLDYSRYSNDTSFTNTIVPYGGKTYSWTVFATAINNALKEIEIEEDRLIGPYFLSTHERADTKTCSDAIAGKLLIYLWDDVLRHGLRKDIFDEQYRTFSDLVQAYRENKPVFSGNIDLPQQDKTETE